jgi:transposase
MGKILYKVTLTQEERSALLSMTKKGKHSSRKVIHGLILLNSDENDCTQSPKRTTNKAIAEHLHVGERMVERIKKRFVEEGLDYALEDKPSEREYKRKADGDLEAHLIALSCSEAPDGFSRWSLRMLADKAVELEYVDSISHETVRRVLKKRIKTVEEKRLGHSTATKR